MSELPNDPSDDNSAVKRSGLDGAEANISLFPLALDDAELETIDESDRCLRMLCICLRSSML